MSQTVTCPNCHTLLRSNRPLPAGVRLRCPDCQGSFRAPAASPAVRLFGPSFVIAVTVSAVLGASIIVAALVISGRRPDAVAQEDVEPGRKDEKRLAAEQKKLADERARMGAEKRKLKHARLLARAEAALAKANYAQAEKLYAEALELRPTDAETLEGLVTARAELAAAAKGDKEGKKKREKAARLLADGKKALAAKKFAEAVRLCEAARDLTPADRAVLAALTEAQGSLDADVDEKKKLTAYKTHMDNGKAALTAERFEDAVRDYLAAVRLMPDDLEAQAGRKQAEAKIAALADKKKRQAAFDNLLARARAAQGAKKYNEAAQQVAAALRLFPGDREAQRVERAVKTALRRVKLENAKLLSRADEAVKLGQVDEAKKLLEEAVENWAEDRKAAAALKTASRLASNAQTTQNAYAGYVQQGALAMATNQYAAAVAAYAEAVRLSPTDLESIRQLRLARRGLAREVKYRVEYDRQVRLGNAALLRGRYDNAVTAFKEALRLLPEDVVATTGLDKARYGRAITLGRKALSLRQKNEAIRFFRRALIAVPGDPTATTLLRQAQFLR